MTFLHPWWLLAAVILSTLPNLLGLRNTTRLRNRISTLLKSLSLAAIAIALAQPEWSLRQHRTAVIALVDTSASIAPQDLQHASAIVREMQSRQGRNWLQIVPFSRTTRPLSEREATLQKTGNLELAHTAPPGGNATSLEAALAGSVFLLPPEHIGRLALLSDGNENQGSSSRAIAELEQLHIPVDTIPLGAPAAAEFRVESVLLPERVYTGEQVPIELTIQSPHETTGFVSLSAEGKQLGSSKISLQAGRNQVRMQARINFEGATVLAGRLSAAGLGEIPFRHSLVLRRAHVLYLSQDPEGSDTNLLATLNQAGYEVSRNVGALASDLSDFQLIILNNLDLNAIPKPVKARLEEYVLAGGGLLLVGGERQVYKEDRKLDALDRALPAQLAPPKSPEGTCVALIIDKSSSMEGRKIELARLSAVGVVDHLRATDYIGVLIFDNSYQWAVPIRRAEDKTLIRRLISGITPDGGTQIAPALAEAYRRVTNAKSTYKHIVLLTDGISEEGDSLDLAREASAHAITISTVGLGQDVNRSYLEKVAATSGGKSYFLNEPSGLEQILLKDVKDYSGSTAVERQLTPLVTHNAEVLGGVPVNAFPPLKGYARFTAKPTADTVLQIDPEAKDPLYVRWQYGLGRAAVFTSDAKSRWAEKWIGWSGFDTFWVNVTRDLLAHTAEDQAAAIFDEANNQIRVTYRLRNTERTGTPPPIFVLGANGFQRALDLHQEAPGAWTGTVSTGDAEGLFRIRPKVTSSSFPELGVYRGEEELLDRAVNERSLRQIADLTGGRYNPSPESVFDSGNQSLSTRQRLWPICLALAIALTLAELVLRKWSAVVARFRPTA